MDTIIYWDIWILYRFYIYIYYIDTIGISKFPDMSRYVLTEAFPDMA